MPFPAPIDTRRTMRGLSLSAFKPDFHPPRLGDMQPPR